MRRLAFFALLIASAGSLLFDLTLPFRLPRESDWAELAGALRAEARQGDALQLWPAWMEEARLHVDSMPVLAEEDLEHADYLGVRRLWLVSLPGAPFAEDPAPPLRERGAEPWSPERRFGPLVLRAWDPHAPETWPLTPQAEEHEVDYVARRCLPVRIGSRFAARGPAARALHLRGGVIGERAFDAGRPPVTVRAFADGVPLGSLTVPRTGRDGTGWRRLDVPVPAGAAEREFSFSIESADVSRPFCLSAWTSSP